MEVHHHSHSSRKKWTHYFWEFLMLFLAVFCGFLTENFREHQIEKDRAKQYIISFYEDLKNDTTRIDQLTGYDDKKIAALGNMYSCYDTVMKNLRSTACMGMLVIHSKGNRGFELADRTLRQLANAGGYRLLNKGDADSIIGYENMYKAYLNFQSTVFQQAQDNVRNTLNQMADFRVLSPYQVTTATTFTGDTISSVLNSSLLFTENKILLNQWFNELSMYLRVTNVQRNIIIQQRDKAISLIQYFKNKYHFQ